MPKIQALVVEDNAMNSEVLTTLLETNGIEAIAIASPDDIMTTIQGMDALRVVFLDLEFPHVDGFEVRRRLVAAGWDPAIPIVAYTVHTSEIDRARREGFHSFLGKPVDPMQFPDQIARILLGQRVWSLP